MIRKELVDEYMELLSLDEDNCALSEPNKEVESRVNQRIQSIVDEMTSDELILIHNMSKYRKYAININTDEDGFFIVLFPDFTWGIADGTTLEEAIKDASGAIEEMILNHLSLNEKVPEAKHKGTHYIRIEKDLLYKIVGL